VNGLRVNELDLLHRFPFEAVGDLLQQLPSVIGLLDGFPHHAKGERSSALVPFQRPIERPVIIEEGLVEEPDRPARNPVTPTLPS
jgi:hypothetical protein